LTYFQVTADHLKVAQGNVRCGQCSNVFSALGNLSEVPPQQNTSAAQSQSAKGKSDTSPTSSKGSPRPSPASTTAAGNNPQSKLTSAIAAIQALNQSSQKILSQGRKNYVSQLQKQAQAKRKFPSSNDSTARDLDQEELEAESVQTGRSETDFDIEEALAAVEDIGVDDEISPKNGNSHRVEDHRNKRPARDDNRQGRKRPKNIKAENADEDIFDFSEQDLPKEEIEIKADKSRKSTTASQNKSRKNISAKKNDANKKPLSKSRTEELESALEEVNSSQGDYVQENRAVYAGAANEESIQIPQTVISDPDVIIENNIPTLAIPKALLEDFEQEKVSHTNYRSMLTWGSLSLLMMLTFLGQAIYFKHNELGQISQLRPWVEMFCKHASCELSLQVDIGQIELLGQDIRSHPKSDGALLVSATIINNASFTQPYPGLQLSFSDMNGVKVATRNFLPKDYLPSKYSRKKGMESNIPIQLELELVDPGKNAVNFEFDFFSI